MNRAFSTDDIALFLIASDHKLSQERVILLDLWENHREWIDAPDVECFVAFASRVRRDALKYQMTDRELDELSLLMQGCDFAFELDFAAQQRIVERYFKLIRLSLIAPDAGAFRKVKLRRLLKAFGYKRRSRQLVDEVQRALDELGLTTWLRGNVPCSVADAGIDDMIMIRLSGADS